MNVFEILLKVYLLEDIELNDSQNKILKLIDNYDNIACQTNYL